MQRGFWPRPRRGDGRAAVDDAVPVIFDPESLLLDPRPGIEYSLMQAMSDFGVAVPRAWFEDAWSPRTPFREALAVLLDTDDPQHIGEAGVRYFKHYNEAGRFRCRLRPGAAQLLAALAREPRLELHYLTHIGARDASRLLDTYGLQQLPRSIVTPETPGCPGLRPPLMRHLVENSARPPEAWVLLSDHPWELMAGRALGLRTVALGYGRASVPVLCQSLPDAIAAHPAEVPGQIVAAPGAMRAAVSGPLLH